MRSFCMSVVFLLAFAISTQLFARQRTASASRAALSPAQAALASKLSADLNRVAASYDGVMGIFVQDLTNGQTFAVNADEVFPTASSIKIPVLIELMRQAQAGKINLAQRVEIERAKLVGGSGVLQFFSNGGSEISIHDLAVLMVVLSDNSATNLLINRVGRANVNAMLRSLDLDKIVLAREMMDNASERANRENRASPREMVTLLEDLNAGKLLDPAHTQMALDILEYYKDSPIRSGIPAGITIAEKPGSLPGAQCDNGIVFLPGRPYAISVMTTFNTADGDAAITAVSARAFNYFSRIAHGNAYGVHVR